MEFLWPILAKIELICQQTQVSGANPSSGVPERMTGGWWGGLAMNAPQPGCSVSVLLSRMEPVTRPGEATGDRYVWNWLPSTADQLKCRPQQRTHTSTPFMLVEVKTEHPGSHFRQNGGNASKASAVCLAGVYICTSTRLVSPPTHASGGFRVAGPAHRNLNSWPGSCFCVKYNHLIWRGRL